MIISILRFEASLFLGALSFVMLIKLLSGQINVSGLLDQVDGKTGKREFSSGRVQLLLMTLFSAGDYLLQVIAHPHVMPEMSNQLILIQGASGGTYLLAKFRSIARNYFN